MKKILLLSFMLLLTLSFSVLAQNRSVTGQVSDESGEFLPGVNVILKGTNTGAITDIDGKYQVSIPSSGSAVLQFSFIGLKSVEIEVGARSVVNVTMQADVETLTEVVVTAAGIERESRRLGYSVTQVKGEEFTKAQETNIINSFQGKVAGVQVTSTGGGPGASSRIQLRGLKSLSDNGTPLFVVDGIPVSNQEVLTGSGITGAFNPGNGAGDLNPADIASVTVLPSANAAALYGNRARNGAIVITTKRGSSNGSGSPSVSINSSVRVDNALVTPDYQRRYTGGNNGIYINTFLNGWGEIAEGQTRTNFQGLPEQLTVQDNIYDQFFETGILAINNVSISNGNENGDFRLGVTSLNQSGLIPTANLERYTISFNAGTKFNEKWTARTTFNYVTSQNEGQSAQGGNTPLAIVTNLQGLPVTTDINQFQFGGGNQDSLQLLTNGYPRLNATNDSPFYTANEVVAETTVDRYFGTISLSVQATDWLNILGRVGLDSRETVVFRSVPVGTLGADAGNFTNDRFKAEQLTTALILQSEWDLGQDWNIKAIAGNELSNRVFDRLQNVAQTLAVPGLNTSSNAGTTTPFNDFTIRRFFGVYGDVTLSYKSFATLNVTGRNDWSSTLPVENRSFFYPSASFSFVITDALNIESNILNFAKLRGGWARVGSDTQAFQLNFNFNPLNNIRGQFGQGNNFPFNGQPGFASTTVRPPLNLTPEFTNSTEFGVDATLFNNKVDLTATYYNIVTTDQILAVPTAPSSGFLFARQNLGTVRNRGFEATLTINPVKTENFSYSTTFTFTRNRFVTIELPEGVDEINIAQSFSGIAVRAVEGEDLGIFGSTFLYDTAADGSTRPVVDGTTGLRLTGQNERLGNINPDFLLGWNNTFTWKGFTLNFLIDYKKGGTIISSTSRLLRNNGLAEETEAGREGGFIDTDGVIITGQDADGNNIVRDNDIVVTPQQFWTNFSSQGVQEANTFDASFVKLREVALNYSLPKSIVDKTPFRGIRFGFQARNLAILYSKVPHIDPESSLFQSASPAAGSEERGGLPNVQSLGGNINLTF